MPSLYDRFTLVSDFTLAGDQTRAIGELVDGLERGDPHQVLLGVTGSEDLHDGADDRPREPPHARDGQQDPGRAASGVPPLFPDNAVEYFVSYYDY
jgi:excinuclease ABC subunit B